MVPSLKIRNIVFTLSLSTGAKQKSIPHNVILNLILLNVDHMLSDLEGDLEVTAAENEPQLEYKETWSTHDSSSRTAPAVQQKSPPGKHTDLPHSCLSFPWAPPVENNGIMCALSIYLFSNTNSWKSTGKAIVTTY